MEEQRPWHRLFGLSWMDFFHGLPVTVVTEKDLSEKKQELDVLIIRKEPGPLDCRLPDGFEDLAGYNLVTFKSHRDKLSVWTLMELIGHHVNVRKQVSPGMDEDELLPEEEFRLYAVCVRYPQQLASQNVSLQAVSEGVYEVQVLTRRIRIIVVNQLPQQEHNAMLHLFSTRAELVSYGVEHYQIRSGQTSTLLLQLYQRYRQEGLTMPDKLEEFARETIDRLLEELPVEKRREGLSLDELLKLLKDLPIQKRPEGLSPEERLKGLSPDELLKALPRETLEELLRRMKDNGSPSDAS
jgi:hypothetical protein